MTTLNATTIASMTRSDIWAYIVDNDLPVAKKRSTEDARKALTAYIATVEPTEEPARSEQVQEVIAMLTEYANAPLAIEEPATTNAKRAAKAVEHTEEPSTTNAKRAAKAVELPTPTHTIEPEQTETDIEPVSRIGSSIVLVAIITAIWVVFTQLLIPAAIGIVKLAMVLYRKAATAVGAIGQSPKSIDYFPDLAEVG